MNPRFIIREATPKDDKALRELFENVHMPSSISISFKREPDFFMGENIGSIRTSIMVAEDTSNNKIVACGARNTRHVFLQGKISTVAYLGGLRFLPEARGGTLLYRGYKLLREMELRDPVLCTYTTILAENIEAVKLLTSGRAGLPLYVPVGKISTYLLPLSRKHRCVTSSNVAKCGNVKELESIVNFLNDYNSQYELATNYNLEDFTKKEFMPFFDTHNIYLYRKNDETYGSLGVWDQSAFKQIVVRQYSKAIKICKPIFNLYASISGTPKLLPICGEIKYVYGAMFSSLLNDTNIAQDLINAAIKDWSGREFDYLVIGLDQKHPLNSMLEKKSTKTLQSVLYAVLWDNQKTDSVYLLKKGIPNIELAFL